MCFVCLFVFLCTHSSDLGSTDAVREGEVIREPVTSLKSQGDLGLLTALGTRVCGGRGDKGQSGLAVWGILLFSILSEPDYCI